MCQLEQNFFTLVFFLDKFVDLAESAELASVNLNAVYLNAVFADLQIKMHMVFGKMATQMLSRELYFVFVFLLSLNEMLASEFYDFTALDIETYKSVPMKNYKGKVRRLLCRLTFFHSSSLVVF